ncbi:MAG: RNA 3'-terminal phosphate cyclase [Methanotrichaceae archaeon]
MIEVDGSYGEGGGQIVRTAVALSAVTGVPVRIRDIRKNRSKPGLAQQHVKAILATGELCDARFSGVEPRSTEIVFEPGEVRGGAYSVDIGTAGSITLLLQCLLPAMLSARNPVSLEVRGGTDVQWSPTIDYFRYVFLPALGSFGVKANLELKSRGYYPIGMGAVRLSVEPGGMKSINLEQQVPKIISGISHCSNLPEHVARRQADAASQELKDAGFKAEISLQVQQAPSTGSGITLWSGHKGGSALGERGIRAEVVGAKAADEIVPELRSDAAVDVHLADQLIPYLAIAGGRYTTREISMHTRTNVWTARHFLERAISVSEGEVCEIKAG